MKELTEEGDKITVIIVGAESGDDVKFLMRCGT